MNRRDLVDVEVAILTQLARGMRSAEIARAVGYSKASVESYIRLMYVKLNARSRPHLVALAYERGILGAPSSAGSPAVALANAHASGM